MGIGFSGEELFMMAIGASVCNDLYREAAVRGIELHQVEIVINGDWSGEPAQARNIRYDVKIQSNASREDTEALVKHTDQIAEIPHTLRAGTAVKLNTMEILR